MRTLLIIDDNLSVRESLKFLLERRGYATELAADGPEGIALAEREEFDGAIIDVSMPGMSGLLVCRILQDRAAAARRMFPVWMMTGARTAEVTQAATEAGALALLNKPFDVADLFRRFDEQFGSAASDAGPAASAP